MLRSLHVEHYVLIDSLEIRFPEGFIVLTGQTGAGKSILLGALSLLMGAKADAGMISDGADSCVVEGEFDGRGDAALEAAVKAEDLDWADGQRLIRRVVSRSGRSRAFLNDEPVSLPVLQALSEHLIDIHSQHQTLRLGDPAFRMSLLDHYAGNIACLAACRKAWNDLQGIRKELAEVTERLRRMAAEKDYNEALFAQLDAAKLRDGELEELETEQKQLAHAEELKEYLNNCEDMLTPADDRVPLTAQLKEAEKQASRAARFIPALEPLVQRLESARLELEDIADELESANARIDVSPDRLEQVEDRMSLLYDLMKKHGVQTVGELIAERDRLSEALFDSTTLEERSVALQKDLARAEKVYADAADALHDARGKASEGFAPGRRPFFVLIDRKGSAGPVQGCFRR